MATYSTYPFYRDTYKGALDEDTYNRLAVLAKAQIDSYTMGRAAYVKEDTPEAESLAYAECAIIDQLDSFGMMETSGGVAGVTSVNNDGYHVTFSASASSEQKTRIWDTLNLWLGWTGLLSRAVRVYNKQGHRYGCWGFRDAIRW